MRNIRETSIACYKKNVPLFSNKQYQKIINFLKKSKYPRTRGEIAKNLNMEKSTISARVNELLQCRILQEAGQRKDEHSNVLSYTVELANKEPLLN